MDNAKIISEIDSVVRSKKVFWIDGDYLRTGESVHWECFVRRSEGVVLVGFDEYLEKYEDAVDLYDAYVRKKLSSIELAVLFMLDSFPSVASKLRQR